jgi:hypothetical protein
MSIHDNRLTADDLSAMAVRVDETLAMWRQSRGDHILRQLHIGPESLMALYRVAVHSIGCSDYDLRDCELEQRDTIVHTAVSLLPR